MRISSSGILTRALSSSRRACIDDIYLEDPVQVHASGFIHMRYFLRRTEYLFGVTADLSFASYELAKDMATTWSNAPNSAPGFRARQRILNRLADYFKAEYDRRIAQLQHAVLHDEVHIGRREAHAACQRVQALARRLRLFALEVFFLGTAMAIPDERDDQPSLTQLKPP